MKTIAPSLFARRRPASGPAPGSPAPGAGHADEFRRLILPHLDAAYNLARYLTRDAELSEDIVQDAVLRAFRSFDQFRGPSPKAWLLAIVRNCSHTSQAATRASMMRIVHESSLSEDGAAAIENSPDPGADARGRVGEQG